MYDECRLDLEQIFTTATSVKLMITNTKFLCSFSRILVRCESFPIWNQIYFRNPESIWFERMEIDFGRFLWNRLLIDWEYKCLHILRIQFLLFDMIFLCSTLVLILGINYLQNGNGISGEYRGKLIDVLKLEAWEIFFDGLLCHFISLN